MDANQEEYLREIWYDPKHPASFAGPLKLYQVVKKEGKYKIGMKTIKQFLQNQDAYSLQRRVLRKNMKRRQVVVDGTDSLWQMDLAFFVLFCWSRIYDSQNLMPIRRAHTVFFVGVGAFVIGLSQISSFVSQ